MGKERHSIPSACSPHFWYLTRRLSQYMYRGKWIILCKNTTDGYGIFARISTWKILARNPERNSNRYLCCPVSSLKPNFLQSIDVVADVHWWRWLFIFSWLVCLFLTLILLIPKLTKTDWRRQKNTLSKSLSLFKEGVKRKWDNLFPQTVYDANVFHGSVSRKWSFAQIAFRVSVFEQVSFTQASLKKWLQIEEFALIHTTQSRLGPTKEI